MAQLPGGRFTRKGGDAAEFYALRSEVYGQSRWRVRKVSEDTQAFFGDLIVVEAAGVNIRLPKTRTDRIGGEVRILNTSGGAGTVLGFESQEIEGASSSVLAAGDRATFVSIDYTAWLRL
jgi:hypothetical protein